MRTLHDIRQTSDNRIAGGIRIFLAILFLMTGAMKLLLPAFADAWSGQLLAANLPLYSFTVWAVPIIEVLLGISLASGLFARPAALVVVGFMIVATYVHIVVDDPSLFPAQPSEPIIPLVVIALSGYLFWKGAGAWSLDLKVQPYENSDDEQ